MRFAAVNADNLAVMRTFSDLSDGERQKALGGAGPGPTAAVCSSWMNPRCIWT